MAYRVMIAMTHAACVAKKYVNEYSAGLPIGA
jgi:hypothetical protein